MQYKETIGELFDWLYIDSETLKKVAKANGYMAEVVATIKVTAGYEVNLGIGNITLEGVARRLGRERPV